MAASQTKEASTRVEEHNFSPLSLDYEPVNFQREKVRVLGRAIKLILFSWRELKYIDVVAVDVIERCADARVVIH